MGKYAEDAKELLRLVGGKENIAAVSHCMTRMRFVLNDPKKADIEKIEAMKAVKGSFTQAGQFQVIIGNTVADFYNDFIAVSGIEGVSKDAVKHAAKQNQNVLQRVIAALVEIFAPLIPAIITGGLILGFRNCIDSLYLFEDGTKTLCQISQFWAGIDSFLWLIGEAVFDMLPVGICWSVTKKMGTTQMLGIVLGLTLVSGQLLNAYAVAGTAAADIPVWDFGRFQVNMIGYQAQVLPAVLAAFTLVYLEKFFRKITPQVVSMIVVPFCSLLLAVMVSHFVLGPVGWKIGSAISSVVYAGITGSFKIVFGAVFGFVYAPLVITGLHHMSNAIDLQLVADYGGTMLWPMIALSNIYQGEELGMTNPGYQSIDEYRDVESIHYYQILIQSGKTSKEALEILGARSRDNGRTPMQWNSKKYAGFSKKQPWIGIPENYKYVNVEAQEQDTDSILHYYRKLIALRKRYKVIQDGSIQFLYQKQEEVFAYQRIWEGQKLLVLNNLSGREVVLQEGVAVAGCRCLLSNYVQGESERIWALRAYESMVWLKEG